MPQSFKVGLSQITKTTPAFIVRLRKAVLYIAGGIGAFTPLLTQWTGWEAEMIAQLSGFTVLVLSGAAEFFGVHIETDTVPAKDVAAIETN